MVEINGATVSEFLDDFTDALRQSRFVLKIPSLALVCCV